MQDTLTPVHRYLLIDTDDLEQVESHLYGYMVTEDEGYCTNKIPEDPTECGCFVSVEVQDEIIRIRQDFAGSFGLFLFENEKHAVISNSLFELADHLKERLSLNRDSINALLNSAYVPVTHTETLFNQIRRLDSQDEVRIDRKTGHLEIVHRKFPYFSQKLETKQDLQDLDHWYHKWVMIYRKLVEKGYPLYCDLSGGYDTRIILSMLINARIDLSSICINSHEKVNLAKDTDDYKIASMIAKDLNFPLNHDPVIKKKTGSMMAKEAYDMARRYSFGNTVMVKYASALYLSPAMFGKGLGSSIKGNTYEDRVEKAEEFYLNKYDKLNEGNGDLFKIRRLRFKRYLAKQFDLMSETTFHDGRDATMIHHRLIDEKFDPHKTIDWTSQNRPVISPFTDPEIVRFDYRNGGPSKYYLVLLILDRYAPCLLNYPVQGREIDEKLLEKARDLNSRFPLTVSFPNETISQKPITIDKMPMDQEDLHSYLKGICQREDFLSTLKKYVPENLIHKIIDECDFSRINKGQQLISALFAIYEAIKKVEG